VAGQQFSRNSEPTWRCPRVPFVPFSFAVDSINRRGTAALTNASVASLPARVARRFVVRWRALCRRKGPINCGSRFDKFPTLLTLQTYVRSGTSAQRSRPQRVPLPLPDGAATTKVPRLQIKLTIEPIESRRETPKNAAARD